MNRDTDIEALDTSLKETQDLIDIIHRKYKSFPDVEHSKSVAALVHLVGKELGMIVKERKLTLELNQTLREKIQDLETETNNRRLATERADAQSKEAKLAEKRAEDAKKRFEEDASRVVVGDEVQKKLDSITIEFKKLSASGNDYAALNKKYGELKIKFVAETNRSDELEGEKNYNNEQREKAIDAYTLIRKDNDALKAQDLALRTKCTELETNYRGLAGKYNNLLATYRRLETDANTKKQDHEALLKSYATINDLVEEIQAGKIVKLCQDCTDLKSKLGEVQSEKEGAQRGIAKLQEQIESERRSSNENYNELSRNHLKACADRDRNQDILKQAETDLAKEKEIVQQTEQAAGKQQTLIEEKTSALASKVVELARKSKDYNEIKHEFDEKCKEVKKLTESMQSERASLESKIEDLKKEHEISQQNLSEKLDEKHNKAFDQLAGEKARQEMDHKDSLARLEEQLRTLSARYGVPSPISPQEESPGGVFVDVKKRKLDHFEGSPESKSKKAWTQHAQKIGAIIGNMVSDGYVDTHQAYYEIARCFALTTAVENFSAYLSNGNAASFCLASLLAVGVANANAIDNLCSICGNCQDTLQECCVHVQLQLGVVRYRLVHAEPDDGEGG